MKHLDSLTQQLEQLSDRLQHPNSFPKLVDSSSKISILRPALFGAIMPPSNRNLHPRVKVDQAGRPLPPKKLSILIGLALKLISLRSHSLLGLKRLNEDV